MYYWGGRLKFFAILRLASLFIYTPTDNTDLPPFPSPYHSCATYYRCLTHTMHSSTSEDVTMDEAFEAPRSPPDSPSCGRLSQPSPSQTPKVLRDLLSRKLEDEFKLEPIAVLPSQREDIEETPTDKKYTSPATDLNPRKPNFLQPRYDRRWPPYEGVVAWWCKASGKGALVERGDGLNHDMMITIKLKDIKGSGYGALCPGSYVTYYRNDRGVWNFWVVTGHAYIL